MGRTRNHQDGLEMPPQRLIENPLVAKRCPGQPGQDFRRRNAYCQRAWQDFQGAWLKHSKYCSLLTVGILHFGILLELIFGSIFGSLLDSSGPLGVPWGLQVDLQGVLEGVLHTTQVQTLEHPGKSDFWGVQGRVRLYRGGMPLARILHTSGPLGRVPACTREHFRILLICGSAEGKVFLKENPVFLKDLQEKERN